MVTPANSGPSSGCSLPSTVVCSRSSTEDPAVVVPPPSTTITPAPNTAWLFAIVLLLTTPKASWLKMPPPSKLWLSTTAVPSMTPVDSGLVKLRLRTHRPPPWSHDWFPSIRLLVMLSGTGPVESGSLTWMPPPCSGVPPAGPPLKLMTDASITSPDDDQMPAPAEVDDWRACRRLVSLSVIVDPLTTRSPHAEEAIPPPRTAVLPRMVESSTVTSAPKAASPPPFPKSDTTMLSSSTTSRRVRLTADGSLHEPLTRMPPPSPDHTVPPVMVRPSMVTTRAGPGPAERLSTLDPSADRSNTRSPTGASPA